LGFFLSDFFIHWLWPDLQEVAIRDLFIQAMRCQPDRGILQLGPKLHRDCNG